MAGSAARRSRAGDADAYEDPPHGAAVAFTGEVDAKTIGLAMAWAAGPVIGRAGRGLRG